MAILLCYDGSPSAQRAVEVAHATLAGRSVVLLHVWSPPVAFLADSFGTALASGGPSILELDRLSLDHAQTVLDGGLELAGKLGADVRPRLERSESSAWRTALDVADEIDAELIIVGTRGVTAVQSALLGSVSNAIVHHSARPVLVVPAETE